MVTSSHQKRRCAQIAPACLMKSGLIGLLIWQNLTSMENQRSDMRGEMEPCATFWSDLRSKAIFLLTMPSCITRGNMRLVSSVRQYGHLQETQYCPRNTAAAYGISKNDDLWVEIYAMRELQYQKMMKRAKVVERPFVKLTRRTLTPPDDR